MTRELYEIAKRYAHDELKDSHSAVEDVVAAAFIDGANFADAHPHWISVEDELPEYDQRVLWCWDDGLISIGRVALDEQHIKARYITHWMPLPQAPKKGGEE